MADGVCVPQAEHQDLTASVEGIGCIYQVMCMHKHAACKGLQAAFADKKGET